MAVKGGPKTGGRTAGTPNKATRDIKALAQKHGPECIKGLSEIAKDKKHPARVVAMRELLDRGYGKAPQAHTGEGGGPIEIKSLLELVDGRTRGLPKSG